MKGTWDVKETKYLFGIFEMLQSVSIMILALEVAVPSQEIMEFNNL